MAAPEEVSASRLAKKENLSVLAPGTYVADVLLRNSLSQFRKGD